MALKTSKFVRTVWNLIALILLPLTSFGLLQDNFFFKGGVGVTFSIEPKKLYKYWGDGLTFEGGIGYFLNDHLTITGDISYSNFRYIGNPELAIPPEFKIIEVRREKSYLIESSIKLSALLIKNEGLINPFCSIGFGYLALKVSDIDIYFWDFVNNKSGGSTHLSGSTNKGFLITFSLGTEICFYGRSVIFIDGGVLSTINANNYYLYIPIKAGIRF